MSLLPPFPLRHRGLCNGHESESLALGYKELEASGGSARCRNGFLSKPNAIGEGLVVSKGLYNERLE